MKTKVLSLLKRRDLLILLSLLLLAAGVFAYLQFHAPKAEAAPGSEGAKSLGEVHIYYGEWLEIYPLGEERTVTIDQGSGHVNHVFIGKDHAYMESSTCENQICVNQGKVMLGDALSFIVCLPNDVVVEVVRAETAEN